MPEWVIVGENADGEPIVLMEWPLLQVWAPIAKVRELNLEPAIFRDRWRAKRQTWRLPLKLVPRAIRRERL